MHHSGNNGQELTNQIDSDFKAKKQRLFQEYENSQEDSYKRRPKSSQPKTKQPISQQSPFAPFVAKSLQVKGETEFYVGAVYYNEKHNFIIICPRNNPIQFYDATTLSLLEGRRTEQLASPVISVSFCQENETFLLGCLNGEIFAYNISDHVLQKVSKHPVLPCLTITFLNSTYYMVSRIINGQLFLGNLENGDFNVVTSEYCQAFFLCHLPKRNLLLSAQMNGSLVVNGTNKLPKLPVLCSVRNRRDVREVQCISVKGKELIVTVEKEIILRIWHIIKGRMRLLKVIRFWEKVSCVAYLENYKMLAITCDSRKIKFLSFPSGKLEVTLDLQMNRCQSIIPMKDKNALGVISCKENIIKIVQFQGEVKE